MKVLLVYPYLPYPEVSHGSGRLLAPLLRSWRARAEITLVCGYRPQEAGRVEETRALVRDLIAVPRPLRADLSAVGRAAETVRTAVRQIVRRDPLHVTKLDRGAFRAAIRAARARTRFDVAQVELSGLARCVEELNGIPSILFDHEAGAASGGALASDARSLRYIREVYPRYSCVGALCREDAGELSAALPRSEIVVRRPGVAAPSPAWRPEPGRAPTVLFFGSPEHLPNRDALAWLSTGIWPRVAAASAGSRCVVVGGVAPGALSLGLAASGIENRGFVPDLVAELRAASVVVAPVRLGRGVRMKNLDALAAGCPLVTTSLGARGLDLVDGTHAMIADREEDLAAAITRLLRDAVLGARIGGAGRAHAIQAFSHETAAALNFDLWTRLAAG